MSASPERSDYPELRRLLHEGADDEELCNAYDRLLVSQNCEGAAVGYLAAVGFICHRRPHLADRMLRHPIDALIQLGAEDSGTVKWFVNHLVNEPDAYHTAIVEWSGPDGLKWLREDFLQRADSLGQLFEECWEAHQARLQEIRSGHE